MTTTRPWFTVLGRYEFGTSDQSSGARRNGNPDKRRRVWFHRDTQDPIRKHWARPAHPQWQALAESHLAALNALDEILMTPRNQIEDKHREIAARALGLVPCQVCGMVGTVPDLDLGIEIGCPNDACEVGFEPAVCEDHRVPATKLIP